MVAEMFQSTSTDTMPERGLFSRQDQNLASRCYAGRATHANAPQHEVER
jgi:hypothetical protein